MRALLLLLLAPFPSYTLYMSMGMGEVYGIICGYYTQVIGSCSEYFVSVNA